MSCYYFVPVNVVLGKKEYIYRQQLLKDILYNPELFLVWSITIFVVLKSVGFLGLISLLEFTGVKNLFAGIAGVSPLSEAQ